ncbi:MATE family efflux transporter [Vibrio albus]|uniref:Multidrug resistance protein NorM n=1 Tax=Vibrio albus TaxID=2200953 RepID=A0A2U3B6H4_9VIBR|nr:MATE family efflux transporter [Vibrio albus]PWI32387.1 MATE family efflux transporter [Vibrio albus]
MQNNQTMSPGLQLYKMTWPMLFGVLSLMSFQLIDSAFIGQLGVLPLAVQGFTMPMQMLIIGLQVGLGIASTAVISKAIGAGKNRYAKQLGGLIIAIGTISLASFGVLIYVLRHTILSLLGAPETVNPIIDQYWPLWLLSSWIGAVLYLLYCLCRANGNTMLPGTMMIVTSLLNLALDPLFIFTFGFGINGAAIATSIAFTVGALYVVTKVSSKHWMLFKWEDLDIRHSLSEIAHIMGPATLSQLLPPLSSTIATKLVAGFGSAAVAAWALGSRFEFFSIVAVLALTMSMPPMIGRLMGEKRTADIRTLVGIAVKFVFGFQLVIAILTFLLATPLVELMSSEPEVRAILYKHLTVVPFSLGLLGICMIMVSVSNALGKSYIGLTISALRLFAFFLPCVWLGAQWHGLVGLFVGALCGNILAGMSAYLFYRKAINQVEYKLSATEA